MVTNATKTDRADLVAQIIAAMDLAVEAHVEAGQLLGAARVLARRFEDPREEAVDMNSDEADEMEEVKEIPAAAADVAELIEDQQALPDGIARISASRLRAIAGLSPDEFRTLAACSDHEFAKAQQVGFAAYLRGLAEAAPALVAAE
jgi:hypothetical protein